MYEIMYEISNLFTIYLHFMTLVSYLFCVKNRGNKSYLTISQWCLLLLLGVKCQLLREFWHASVE